MTVFAAWLGKKLMKHAGKAFLFSFLLLLSCSVVRSQQEQMVLWQLNSLESIHGHNLTISGAPQVVDLPKGEKAIAFNGISDGLLVDANPIAGAEAFSIEVTFKPYAAGAENTEQRFLHIEDPANPNRRILIELRLNGKGEWFADFFMRTEDESLTLIDSTKTHPVNEWATITLAYKDEQLKGYVNGVEEVAGAIVYQPISASAKTSLGTRMDQRSWFIGELKSVTFKRL